MVLWSINTISTWFVLEIIVSAIVENDNFCIISHFVKILVTKVFNQFSSSFSSQETFSTTEFNLSFWIYSNIETKLPVLFSKLARRSY